MARMFGTDGVRGVAGSELTIELATKLGQAGAYVLTKEQEHQATIIVGCDTRISGVHWSEIHTCHFIKIRITIHGHDGTHVLLYNHGRDFYLALSWR